MVKRSESSGKKGFTLVELIVVLALMAILAGLTVMGVIYWRHHSEFLKNENYARTIFLNAQVSLSSMDAGGTLDDYIDRIVKAADIADAPDNADKGKSVGKVSKIISSDKTFNDGVLTNNALHIITGLDGKVLTNLVDKYGGDWDSIKEQLGETHQDDYETNINSHLYDKAMSGFDNMYYIVMNGADKTGAGAELVQELLGNYVIDSSALDGGCVLIEINSETRTVCSVFYDSWATSLSYSGKYSSKGKDGDTDISALHGSVAVDSYDSYVNDRSSEHREKYVLGYYSEDEIGNVVKIKTSELKINRVRLINSEKLTLEWSCNSDIEYYTIDIYDNSKVGAQKVPLLSGEIRAIDKKFKSGNAELNYKTYDAENKVTGEVSYSFPYEYDSSTGKFTLILDAMMTADDQQRVVGTTDGLSITRIPGFGQDMEITATVTAYAGAISASGNTSPSHTLFGNDTEKDKNISLTQCRHFYNIRYTDYGYTSAIAFNVDRRLDWYEGSQYVYTDDDVDGIWTTVLNARFPMIVRYYDPDAKPETFDNRMDTEWQFKCVLKSASDNYVLANFTLDDTSIAIRDQQGNLQADGLGLIYKNGGNISDITLSNISVACSNEDKYVKAVGGLCAYNYVSVQQNTLFGLMKNVEIVSAYDRFADTEISSLDDVNIYYDSDDNVKVGVGGICGVTEFKYSDVSADDTVIGNLLHDIAEIKSELESAELEIPKDVNKIADLNNQLETARDAYRSLYSIFINCNADINISNTILAAKHSPISDYVSTDKLYQVEGGIGGITGTACFDALKTAADTVFYFDNCDNKGDICGNINVGGICGYVIGENIVDEKSVQVRDCENKGLILCDYQCKDDPRQISLGSKQDGCIAVDGGYYCFLKNAGGITGFGKNCNIKYCIASPIFAGITVKKGDGISFNESFLTEAQRKDYNDNKSILITPEQFNETLWDRYILGDCIGGIIGYVDNSKLDGCQTTGGYVIGYDYVGGISGYTVAGNDKYITSNNKTINKSYVIGHSNVGGISGTNSGKSTIKDCVNNGIVAGNGEYVGGIVGYNCGELDDGGLVSEAEINYCTNYLVDFDGTISAMLRRWGLTADFVGGICGYNEYGTIIYDNKKNDKDNETMVSAVIIGNNFIGGVVGFNGVFGNIDLSELSTKTGTTIGEAKDDNNGGNYVGGYIGLNMSQSVFENIATLTIKPTEVVGNNYVGGAIGANLLYLPYYGDTNINMNIAVENEFGTVSASGSYVGGVIGYNAIITNKDDINIPEKLRDNDNMKEILYRFPPKTTNNHGVEAVINYDGYGKVVSNINVSGGALVGGIVGYNKDGTNLYISNCINKSSVSIIPSSKISYKISDILPDKEYRLTKDIEERLYVCGGIISYNSTTTVIDGCKNEGAVIGRDCIGGICGINAGLVYNCDYDFNIGRITSNYVGGICGINILADAAEKEYKVEKDNIEIRYTSGTVKDCELGSQSSMTVSGSSYTGGIVGYNTQINYNDKTNNTVITYNAVIENCKSCASVRSNSSSEYIGGIAGKNNGEIKFIGGTDVGLDFDNYVAVGINEQINITIKGGTNVGGVVGANDGEISIYTNEVDGEGKIVAVTNIVMTGKNVTVDGEKSVGGIVGLMESGTIVNAATDTIKYYSFATVTAKGSDIESRSAGGIAGKLESGAKLIGGINIGSVSATKGYAGGIVSYVEQNSELNKCVNMGDITASNGDAGGIAAVNSGVIEGCSVSGGGYNVKNNGVIKSGTIENIQLYIGAVNAMYDLTNQPYITSDSSYNDKNTTPVGIVWLEGNEHYPSSGNVFDALTDDDMVAQYGETIRTILRFRNKSTLRDINNYLEIIYDIPVNIQSIYFRLDNHYYDTSTNGGWKLNSTFYTETNGDKGNEIAKISFEGYNPETSRYEDIATDPSTDMILNGLESLEVRVDNIRQDKEYSKIRVNFRRITNYGVSISDFKVELSSKENYFDTTSGDTIISTSGEYAGGIVAINYGDINNSTIDGSIDTKCNNMVQVKSSKAMTYGGLVGLNDEDGRITGGGINNYALTYKKNQFDNLGHGELTVSGAVGNNLGTVTSVNVEHNISIDRECNYIGGVVGSNSGIVVLCSYSGTINETAPLSGNCIGGIAAVNKDGGKIQKSFCKSINVTSAGISTMRQSDLADDKSANSTNVGGIVAINNENCTVEECYIEAGRLNVNNGLIGGIAGYNKGKITKSGAYVYDNGKTFEEATTIKNVLAFLKIPESNSEATDEQLSEIFDLNTLLSTENAGIITSKLQNNNAPSDISKITSQFSITQADGTHGYIAGIAALNYKYGEITNCVTGNDWCIYQDTAKLTDADATCSGIIAMNETEKTLSGLVNCATVIRSNKQVVGGIVCRQENQTSNWTMKYCYNFGYIYTNSDRAGGIIGQIKFFAGSVEYCFNYGNVKASQGNAAGIVSGCYGIVPKTIFNIDSCVNIGNISVGSGKTGAAGINTSFMNTNDIDITYVNCVNFGKVGNAGIASLSKQDKCSNLRFAFYKCRNYGECVNDINTGGSPSIIDCFAARKGVKAINKGTVNTNCYFNMNDTYTATPNYSDGKIFITNSNNQTLSYKLSNLGTMTLNLEEDIKEYYCHSYQLNSIDYYCNIDLIARKLFENNKSLFSDKYKTITDITSAVIEGNSIILNWSLSATGINPKGYNVTITWQDDTGSKSIPFEYYSTDSEMKIDIGDVIIKDGTEMTVTLKRIGDSTGEIETLYYHSPLVMPEVAVINRTGKKGFYRLMNAAEYAKYFEQYCEGGVRTNLLNVLYGPYTNTGKYTVITSENFYNCIDNHIAEYNGTVESIKNILDYGVKNGEFDYYTNASNKDNSTIDEVSSITWLAKAKVAPESANKYSTSASYVKMLYVNADYGLSKNGNNYIDLDISGTNTDNYTIDAKIYYGNDDPPTYMIDVVGVKGDINTIVASQEVSPAKINANLISASFTNLQQLFTENYDRWFVRAWLTSSGKGPVYYYFEVNDGANWEYENSNGKLLYYSYTLNNSSYCKSREITKPTLISKIPDENMKMTENLQSIIDGNKFSYEFSWVNNTSATAYNYVIRGVSDGISEIIERKDNTQATNTTVPADNWNYDSIILEVTSLGNNNGAAGSTVGQTTIKTFDNVKKRLEQIGQPTVTLNSNFYMKYDISWVNTDLKTAASSLALVEEGDNLILIDARKTIPLADSDDNTITLPADVNAIVIVNKSVEQSSMNNTVYIDLTAGNVNFTYNGIEHTLSKLADNNYTISGQFKDAVIMPAYNENVITAQPNKFDIEYEGNTFTCCYYENEEENPYRIYQKYNDNFAANYTVVIKTADDIKQYTVNENCEVQKPGNYGELESDAEEKIEIDEIICEYDPSSDMYKIHNINVESIVDKDNRQIDVYVVASNDASDKYVRSSDGIINTVTIPNRNSDVKATMDINKPSGYMSEDDFLKSILTFKANVEEEGRYAGNYLLGGFVLTAVPTDFSFNGLEKDSNLIKKFAYVSSGTFDIFALNYESPLNDNINIYSIGLNSLNLNITDPKNNIFTIDWAGRYFVPIIRTASTAQIASNWSLFGTEDVTTKYIKLPMVQLNAPETEISRAEMESIMFDYAYPENDDIYTYGLLDSGENKTVEWTHYSLGDTLSMLSRSKLANYNMRVKINGEERLLQVNIPEHDKELNLSKFEENDVKNIISTQTILASIKNYDKDVIQTKATQIFDNRFAADTANMELTLSETISGETAEYMQKDPVKAEMFCTESFKINEEEYKYTKKVEITEEENAGEKYKVVTVTFKFGNDDEYVKLVLDKDKQAISIYNLYLGDVAIELPDDGSLNTKAQKFVNAVNTSNLTLDSQSNFVSTLEYVKYTYKASDTAGEYYTVRFDYDKVSKESAEQNISSITQSYQIASLKKTGIITDFVTDIYDKLCPMSYNYETQGAVEYVSYLKKTDSNSYTVIEDKYILRLPDFEANIIPYDDTLTIKVNLKYTSEVVVYGETKILDQYAKLTAEAYNEFQN